MKKAKDERVRVLHMRDAAEKVLHFMRGRTRTDLDTDEMLALAVTRLLEIIGEAAKNVPSELRNAHPHVPWSVIARTRDRLAHGYEFVDMSVVWLIVQDDLPPLLSQLQGIIAVMGTPDAAP